MPSPFPGMDPYLEAPGLWPDVHHGLISEMQAVLNRRLRPKYHVRVEERVFISDEGDPGKQVILLDEEVHEARLEVVDRADRSVVTVLEVLSPTNKVAGARGQASYAQKRQEILRSPSHLVEIDLLREGTRPAVREELPTCHYTVHIAHAERRPKGRTWPIRLPQRLPRIPVPLRGGDPDVLLDLQEVLAAVYERAAYDLEIDYAAEPVPPLEGPDADWADQVLRVKQLR